MNDLILNLAAALWPPRCACCDHPLSPRAPQATLPAQLQPRFCAACLTLIEPREGPRCLTCHAAQRGPLHRCGRCLVDPPAFERAYGLFDYAGPIGEALRRGKYGRDPSLIALVGLHMGAWLPAELWRDPPSVLLPAPLHPRRLAQRGYAPPRVLAEAVGRALGRPVRCGRLLRVRHTPPQAGLRAGQRRENVRGAFEARGPLPDDALIIDDVLTTGETARAMSKALRRAGVG
ncbi:ComF family protein, partial [Myxococcota bacterium]|nr:ComF family protein [Myxococcota bacterium]